MRGAALFEFELWIRNSNFKFQNQISKSKFECKVASGVIVETYRRRSGEHELDVCKLRDQRLRLLQEL